MIIKIWPIKADYGGSKGKVGGAEGIKNAVAYITDETKTITKDAVNLTPELEEIDAMGLDCFR